MGDRYRVYGSAGGWKGKGGKRTIASETDGIINPLLLAEKVIVVPFSVLPPLLRCWDVGGGGVRVRARESEEIGAYLTSAQDRLVLQTLPLHPLAVLFRQLRVGLSWEWARDGGRGGRHGWVNILK